MFAHLFKRDLCSLLLAVIPLRVIKPGNYLSDLATSFVLPRLTNLCTVAFLKSRVDQFAAVDQKLLNNYTIDLLLLLFLSLQVRLRVRETRDGMLFFCFLYEQEFEGLGVSESKLLALRKTFATIERTWFVAPPAYQQYATSMFSFSIIRKYNIGCVDTHKGSY